MERLCASDSFSTLALYKFIYLLTYLLMYAEHGNLIDMDASGTKASTKYLDSRLEVTQGHAF